MVLNIDSSVHTSIILVVFFKISFKKFKRTDGFPSLRFLQIANVYDDVSALKLSLLYLTTNAHRLQKIRFGTKERFQCDKYDRSESEMTLQAWIESFTK